MEPEPPRRTLGRDFFSRDTQTVARDLLGVWLLRSTPDGIAGGPITEVEAYLGPEDKASHTRAGLTPRTAPMFGEVGHAYVYFVYGMHYCLNVVAYADAVAGAVLIRALEPRVGIELIARRRGGRPGPEAKLTSGPARLCQALAVTREFNGHDLTTGDQLWLARDDAAPEVAHVSVGPRVGVDYAGEGWAERPLRFWLTGNPSVSGLQRTRNGGTNR